jgi:hypothetical protein
MCKKDGVCGSSKQNKTQKKKKKKKKKKKNQKKKIIKKNNQKNQKKFFCRAKCFAELEFRSEVLNVRLRRDKIVVVLHKMVYVYNFADLALLNKHDTFVNPLGLCALCADHNNTVLACPAIKPGHVRVDLFDINKSHVIAAHTGELTQVVLVFEI